MDIILVAIAASIALLGILVYFYLIKKPVTDYIENNSSIPKVNLTDFKVPKFSKIKVEEDDDGNEYYMMLNESNVSNVSLKVKKLIGLKRPELSFVDKNVNDILSFKMIYEDSLSQNKRTMFTESELIYYDEKYKYRQIIIISDGVFIIGDPEILNNN